MKVILASKSPRRIEILKENGLNPIIYPVDIDENIPVIHSMEETVMYIALKKGLAARAKWLGENPEKIDINTSKPNLKTIEKTIIISADTIVYKDGEIMGKPKDKRDGFIMLSKLRDTYHYVATGVAIMDLKTGITKSFVDVTKVYLKYYTDDALDKYLDTDEAYDKAGGYGIQAEFAKYLDRIEGDYDNVVGLPWYRVKKELEYNI